MTVTDKFAIVGSIFTTLMFLVYILVEFPKLSANIKSINRSVVALTSNSPRITKFITLFSFFGSLFMSTLLACLVFDSNFTVGRLEYALLILMLLELIFWLTRLRAVI